MNRLSGGQAKNEREIMMQLKSTVHGGGALDDMPNSVIAVVVVVVVIVVVIVAELFHICCNSVQL